jgi:hypothetical protein
MESSHWEYWNIVLCRKVQLLTGLHCQFRGVDQGMKQTKLYLWYPLFLVQWDRCEQWSLPRPNRKAQLVPIGLSIEKPLQSNISNVLSIKNLFMMSASDTFLGDAEWFLENKSCPRNKGYHRYSFVCFIPWSTPRNWQWRPVKSWTLRQRTIFQSSQCELSIYM